MALGSTQSGTEISITDLPGGLRQPVLRADNLATLMCQLFENPGSRNILGPLGPI
jgi:hypothetical protein